jgi:CRP-like cAMP-binding protein
VKGEAISDETLGKIPAFRGLNPGECHQLMEVARTRSFQPGERVLVQGRTSQYLWIVLDGQCQVVRDAPSEGPVVLAELEPFSLFGEMSFFSPAPHSATVVAKTPLVVLSIARVDFDDLVHDGVIAAYKLAYNIVEGVATKLRRMDERMAELAGHGGEPAAGSPSRHPDWRRFREKLLDDWNL